jgi:hypothetical protein
VQMKKKNPRGGSESKRTRERARERMRERGGRIEKELGLPRFFSFYTKAGWCGAGRVSA